MVTVDPASPESLPPVLENGLIPPSSAAGFALVSEVPTAIRRFSQRAWPPRSTPAAWRLTVLERFERSCGPHLALAAELGRLASAVAEMLKRNGAEQHSRAHWMHSGAIDAIRTRNGKSVTYWGGSVMLSRAMPISVLSRLKLVRCKISPEWLHGIGAFATGAAGSRAVVRRVHAVPALRHCCAKCRAAHGTSVPMERRRNSGGGSCGLRNPLS